MEFNGTFLAVIISFLVFVFLMNKLLYEPVRRVVKERNDFVDGNYSNADANTKEAEELTAECDEKISAAKEDARIKYNGILDDYKNKKSEMVQNAQSEANAHVDESYIQLNNISNEAKENLKGRMYDLANDIVEKVLGYRSEVHSIDNDAVNRILYH